MKPRAIMQVSPLFLKKVKEIKGKFIIKGVTKSLTDITEEIVNLGCIDNVGEEINQIKIKMDKRRRFL